ncbi:MAG: ATP-binding protein [Clostridiaceae bacterium]|nr:ATP-binding protein [Clostridiaceae bacterium]
MKQYLPRLVDGLLEKELEAFGAVLITGPKWCGKTTTGLNKAKSTLFLQNPDEREQNLRLADVKPSLLLEGDNPRLIDEWQDAPQLWDSVRFSIDQRSETGLYILTGSTSVDKSLIAHTGTGRISRLKMRTMSLFESGDSNGEVSITQLLKSEEIASKSPHTIEDIANLIVGGGWPASIGKPLEVKQRQVAGYCKAIVNTEISTADGISRDSEKVYQVLRSYSRHISTQSTIQTITSDVTRNFDSINRKTVGEYLEALQKIFVIEDLKAWSPKLRSKTTIATSSTRHFVDPAIAACFLDANPVDLLNDLETMGLLFESLVVRDLRIYAESLGGSVYHYRDHSGQEADAILHFPNGQWGAIEVKLGNRAVDEGAESLIKLADKIDKDSMKSPSFLAVITGSGYAYRREDGVYVIPIGCLRN